MPANDPRPARCTGVILAGGRATRFAGRPKGLERVGGERIIDRVGAALRAACDDILLVANDPGSTAWLPGVPVCSDVVRGAGGLGGIHAALTHARGDAVVVAWDMPFVPASLLQELRTFAGAADVVVPASPSWRGIEPLCAFYSRRCLPAIQESLDTGDYQVVSFHSRVRVHVLSAEEVSRHGDAAAIFMNVNTPDELQIANAMAGSHNSAPGNHEVRAGDNEERLER